MNDSTSDEKKRLYSAFEAEVYKRQLSNSENYDKAVLTYAMASLGFSLGFLKDFIPITVAIAPWMLYASWASLVISVLLTIISFQISQAGLKKQLDLAKSYYLGNDDKAVSEYNRFIRLTEGVNLAAGGTFIAGLVFTTLFVALNIAGAAKMSEQKTVRVPLGATIPEIQKAQKPDSQRGAPIPQIQPVVPVAPAPPPAPAPAGTPAMPQPKSGS